MRLRLGCVYCFSREFLINDYVSPDGKEIIFSRLKENANVILIDLPGFR